MPKRQNQREPEEKDWRTAVATLLGIIMTAFLLGRWCSRNDAPPLPVTTAPAHRPDGPAIDRICAASRHLIRQTNHHQLGPVSLFEVLGLDPNTPPFAKHDASHLHQQQQQQQYANGPPGRNAQDAVLEAWSRSLAGLVGASSSSSSSSSSPGQEGWEDEAHVEWARILDMAADVLVGDAARGLYLRTVLPRMGSAAEAAAASVKGKGWGGRGRQAGGDEHVLRREAMVRELLSFCRENGSS